MKELDQKHNDINSELYRDLVIPEVVSFFGQDICDKYFLYDEVVKGLDDKSSYYRRIFDLYYRGEPWYYKGKVYKITLIGKHGSLSINIDYLSDSNAYLKSQNRSLNEHIHKSELYLWMLTTVFIVASVGLNLTVYIPIMIIAAISVMFYFDYKNSVWKREVKRLYQLIAGDDVTSKIL